MVLVWIRVRPNSKKLNFSFQGPESPVVLSTTIKTTTPTTTEIENIVPEKCVNCLTTGLTTDGQSCHDYQPCVEWGKHPIFFPENIYGIA